MVVADGLGGHVGGNLASSLAVEMFGAAVAEDTHPVLPSIAFAIHDAIRTKQASAPELRGMATTLSGLIVNQSPTVPTSALMRYIHSGDTRIALQRGNGIKRLTQDHSEAQRLLVAGLLSREEYATYPRKNVLESALGISTTPRVDYDEVDLIAGDRVFITSDGAHTKVLLREMKEVSDQSESAEAFVQRMCATIKERNPDDNFSVAALFFQ
jgi:protein phosphatase